MNKETFKKYVKPIGKGLAGLLGSGIGYMATTNIYGAMFGGGAGATIGDIVVDWAYKDFND